MVKKEKIIIPNQICKTQTDKVVLEFQDYLVPASSQGYAHLHAGFADEVGEDGKKAYSFIKVSMLDSSKAKNVSVSYNLEPATVKWLKGDIERTLTAIKVAEMMQPYVTHTLDITERKINFGLIMLYRLGTVLIQKLERLASTEPTGQFGIPKESYQKAQKASETISLKSDYSFYNEKIYANSADKKGLCTVRKIQINRNRTAQDGTEYRLPWLLRVEEGKALAKQNAAGGFYSDSATYTAEKSINLRLTDQQIMEMITQAADYINIFEQRICAEIVACERGAVISTTDNGKE